MEECSEVLYAHSAKASQLAQSLGLYKTQKNSNFLKRGKMVISVENSKFF